MRVGIYEIEICPSWHRKPRGGDGKREGEEDETCLDSWLVRGGQVERVRETRRGPVSIRNRRGGCASLG